MLVLSRKVGETLIVGNEIAVTIVRVNGNTVRLAIEAPDNVRVLRQELLEKAKDYAGVVPVAEAVTDQPSAMNLASP